MPQLDFGNPLILSQVVWMALIFGALYMLLDRWALPQVASVLEDRAALIAADLVTARDAKEAADRAVAELRDAMARATAESQLAISTASAQAKAEAAERARVANEALDAQLAAAEQRIDAARTAAMGALREVAADTATAVVTRLTGQAPAPALIDAAIARNIGTRG